MLVLENAFSVITMTIPKFSGGGHAGIGNSN